MVVFSDNYYTAMDRIEPAQVIEPIAIEDKEEVEKQSKWTPEEIGMTTNPMQNQLQSLQAKIREGAARIEFEFLGAGKSNSQQPSPEAFGKDEREAMRDLVTINDVKTSVH